jgi:hypothetical protein
LKKRVELERISYPSAVETPKRKIETAVPSPVGRSTRLWKGNQDSYRGIALAEVVEGMKVIGKRSSNE